jgi:type IV pilus assembly protein PilW
VKNDLIDTYAGGQVRLINTISYFVRTENGQPSLYRRIGANNAQELVEGVEGMEIFYGVDTDAEGTANYYVRANQVNAADWARNVVSVRISLLVATIDNNLTAQPAGSFSFNGQNTPADRKLRRVFTSTIALRNRLP